MEDFKYEEVGTLNNGEKVYRELTKGHWNQHTAVTKKLFQEAISKIDINELENKDVIVKAIDLGRTIGKCTCVPTSDKDTIYMAKRINRIGETPMVLDREPIDCSSIVVILEKEDDKYVVLTTFIGSLSPMEPWDPKLNGDEEKIKEAIEFWKTHALIYESSVVESVVLPNGKRVSKKEFEDKYKINNSSDEFDIPKDSLILMMGIPGSGKSAKAKETADLYNGIIFSSDEIREELFSKQDKKDIFSDQNKEMVYKEMCNRIDESLKNGNLTIADATFIFKTGEDARKKLLELASKYNRPVRAIVLKVPLEVALKQNKKRTRKVDEEVIKQMSEYMDSFYDGIISEINELKNAKIKIIGNEKINENSYDSMRE